MSDIKAAFSRGASDARRGRSPIWRDTGTRGIVMNGGGEWDEDMADEWSLGERKAYLKGYEVAS